QRTTEKLIIDRDLHHALSFPTPSSPNTLPGESSRFFRCASPDAPMTINTVGDFARHLSDKNYIVSELSLNPGAPREQNGDLSLRKLWEQTDLSANDFADEVAYFYGLPRIALPQLVAASPLTAPFSPRFLRETTVFPYQTPDRHTKLALADPSDA